MALSLLRSQAIHHVRSFSLPSKSHPSISQLNENLAKIHVPSETLNGLETLYSNIDDLLTLPHIRQIISRESHENWFDRVMDGYIRLLDACAATKDLVSHTKHNVRQLLSAIRRKDAKGIESYRTSRKNSKKMVRKALKDLKSFKSAKHNDLLSLGKDRETLAVVYVLKEAEAITITMFESLLSHVIGNKVEAKRSGWSLASKLILPSKKVSNQREEMDSSYLKEMESRIDTLEEELECLFKQLIKTRVFLLNIL